MKSISLLVFFALLLRASAQVSEENLDRLEREGLFGPRQPASPPEIDARKLIKESNSFLREREPEMTGEEYALYEQVITMMTNNPEFAVRMLETMMNDKQPASPAFEFILGNAYYAAGQLPLAEKRYQGALQRYPTFLRAWKNLGVLHYSAGRFDEAARCFSKAVTLGDRDSSTFGLLGFSLEKGGDFVSAEMAYLQALSGEPASSDWKEGLLRIYLDGRQYGRAEPLLRRLIKERPTEKRLWLNYANLLIADQRKLEAIAVLEAAQAAGGAGPEELILLGDLLAEQGLAREALRSYQNILPSNRPRGEEKLLQLARTQIDARDFTAAETTLAALNGELTPSGRRTRRQIRADLFMAQQRWAEAHRELDSLLAEAPLNGRALLTLGRVHLAEQSPSHALLAFEAAYRIADTTYAAAVELANLELKNRHYAKAVEYLEQALKLQKNDVLESYLTRLKTLLPVDEPTR